MILVVGELSATGRGAAATAAEDFRFVAFADLTAAVLDEVRPGMVLSSLVSKGYDAVDVARSLARLGFTGLYRALSPPLPDPRAVRDEVRGAAPGLDFDLIIVGEAIH